MPNSEKDKHQVGFNEAVEKLLNKVINGEISQEESLEKMADLVEKYKKVKRSGYVPIGRSRVDDGYKDTSTCGGSGGGC